MATSRQAVVIGVNRYEDGGIPELKGAENDATELRQRLADQESGGFEIAEGHFLVGKDATCDAVRRAMSDLLWKIDSSDLSLFYFSGHGFHDEYGNGYIAPWDMLRNEPLVRGIRMQELTELLLAAKKKKTILIILDCCYSGIATEGKAGTPKAMEAAQFDQWFSSLHDSNGKGRMVWASAGKDEKSHELLACAHTLSAGGADPHPHGAFTYHLLEALDGKAATGENDEITLEGLLKYVETQMNAVSEHKPTFFGASMSDVGTIRIARANQWRKIREFLHTATKRLNMGDPFGAFAAAKVLGHIRTDFAMLPEAADLKREVDAKLSAYRVDTNRYLMKKKFDLPDHRNLVDRLQLFVGTLSVDAILNLSSEPEFTSLLESLVSVSCTSPDGESYRSETVFLFELSTYANAQAHAGSVAKLETPGQGKVS